MMRTIILCGRGRCCPEVHIEKDEVRISDDYGNEIVMDKEQFEILKNKIEAGEV